jgi:hypothetical protein
VGKFYNVIVCDDVREEKGNKKSLMGVFGGDVLVPEFPAQIQLAIFFQYLRASNESGPTLIEFRLLQDEDEIAHGRIEANVHDTQPATVVLPKAMIGFEKQTAFRMLASVSGGPEEEILNKKIRQV